LRSGAGDEIRTRDIQLGRLKLYQLSYSRTFYADYYLIKKPLLKISIFLKKRSKSHAGSHVVVIDPDLQTEISYIRLTLRLVVGGGFEPPKASPTDLQSVPFDHSGTPPKRYSDITSEALYQLSYSGRTSSIFFVFSI
jgi:hypothetical protein